MDRVVIVGKTYRHFKGKDYKVLCIAKDSDSDPEDLREVVKSRQRILSVA